MRRGVAHFLAGLPDREHVAGLDPVARAAVDDDDVVVGDHGAVVDHGHDRAVDLRLRRARDEVDLRVAGERHQDVAVERLARGIHDQHRGRIAGALEIGLAREQALVAEHVAVVRVLQLVADVIDAVAGAEGGAAEAAHVDLLARRGREPVVAAVRDVRRALDLLLREHGRPLHECRDVIVRDRVDRLRQRMLAHARRQARGATLRDGHARLPVHPGERERVARIDQVRVRDLRVDVPDLRPVPGVGEELRGDVPQRVARLHHVGRGRVRRHRDDAAVDALLAGGRHCDRERDQRGGRHAAGGTEGKGHEGGCHAIAPRLPGRPGRPYNRVRSPT